ncbi:MAG: NADH-quinone oxidoreductase subunit NuoE [Oscillospiraceae bacterium]|nr:NADH-quinone oxidoreductase subunit NuoE [Oscillospiraceae bacterium]
MSCNCKNEPRQELENYLENGNKTESDLIPILQKAQEIYGWLPPEVLSLISEKTGIKPAKIMGVVTFYAQFRTKPVGKNLILLCQGTACHVNGSADIESAVKGELNTEEGEMTEDGLFTYNNVACLGCCSLSPVMMIGDKTYGKLTKESTVRVLNEVAKGVKA